MKITRSISTAVLVGVLAMAIASCGGGGWQGGGPASFGRLRMTVVRGAAADFVQGTGIGGPAFESCVLRLLGRALDPPTLERLVGVYGRPDGQPLAAQALNALVSPLAARCGHRTYVPELVEASRGLRAGGAD